MSRSWQIRSVLLVAVFGLCASVSFARTTSPASAPSIQQTAAAYPLNPMPTVPPPSVAAAYPLNPMPTVPPPSVA